MADGRTLVVLEENGIPVVFQEGVEGVEHINTHWAQGYARVQQTDGWVTEIPMQRVVRFEYHEVVEDGEFASLLAGERR